MGTRWTCWRESDEYAEHPMIAGGSAIAKSQHTRCAGPVDTEIHRSHSLPAARKYSTPATMPAFGAAVARATSRLVVQNRTDLKIGTTSL
jgi:hypothetical protein